MDIATLTGASSSPRARKRFWDERTSSPPPQPQLARSPPVSDDGTHTTRSSSCAPLSVLSSRSPTLVRDRDAESDRDRSPDGRYASEKARVRQAHTQMDTQVHTQPQAQSYSPEETQQCVYSTSPEMLATYTHSSSYPTRSSLPPTVLELASVWPGKTRIIPQKIYQPPRGYRMGDVPNHRPIMFFLTNPSRCGISCRDALRMIVTHLVSRDDPVFEDCGPAVSLRLMWPGYPPWSRQIPTRDFKRDPQPITLARLAKNVARTVELFMKDMNTRMQSHDADRRWKISEHNGVKFDDLELIGLQHVSMGSWQVHLRLRGPSTSAYGGPRSP